MPEPIARFNMQTDFGGLLQIVAKSLYREPDVFIRELVQNAHDAIVRRREIEGDLAGRIEIVVDPAKDLLSITDNGLGMDEYDIRTFLAVIGSTGTGTAAQALRDEGIRAAYELIGQFGIGMLSSFVVAAKVEVHTRKVGSGQAFAWHNSGGVECELYADDRTVPGTQVIVHFDPKYKYLLDDARLRSSIIKYCDFIQFPISVNGDGPINAIDAPWHKAQQSTYNESAYGSILARRFSDVPIDIIPVDLPEPYPARGAIYISAMHIPDVNTTGVVDIFVRRVFVKGGDTSLLPPWAKFVRGVIDSPVLSTTASRDDVQHDDAFDALHLRLGELIVARLLLLAKEDPEKFRQINAWHHWHLKGMAFFYDEFFDQVVESLLFNTNKKEMSLRDYLGRHSPRPDKGDRIPIYYFANEGSAAQFYQLADARGLVVINAGWVFEEELLEKYARSRDKTVYLERLDTSDAPELFEPLDPTEEPKYQQMASIIESALRRADVPNVTVRMRRFAPSSLPAVMIASTAMVAEERLRALVSRPWVFSEIVTAVGDVLGSARVPFHLTLNANNSLIQRAVNTSTQDDILHELWLGIYNSAILNSQHLLTTKNAQIMHGQVVRLLHRLLEQHERVSGLNDELRNVRMQILEYKERQVSLDADLPDHVLIFMITPFADEYKVLEDAVRRVFERAPYFFEVRLARDYTFKAGLLDNVREHMVRAHGFVAEVTEQKPNVMFEVGAAMMPDDGRPVFTLRAEGAILPVPADFKEKLLIPYGSLSDPTEKLENDIRRAFEKDGRVIHDGINELLNRRKKRFLSRAVIEELQVRLEDNQMRRLMQKYRTIEDVLDASDAEVAGNTSIPDFLIPAIKGDLSVR